MQKKKTASSGIPRTFNGAAAIHCEIGISKLLVRIFRHERGEETLPQQGTQRPKPRINQNNIYDNSKAGNSTE